MSKPCFSKTRIILNQGLRISADEDWYLGHSPEIPVANGQGRTIKDCKISLSKAISLILAYLNEDAFRGIPADAKRETIILS